MGLREQMPEQDFGSDLWGPSRDFFEVDNFMDVFLGADDLSETDWNRLRNVLCDFKDDETFLLDTIRKCPKHAVKIVGLVSDRLRSSKKFLFLVALQNLNVLDCDSLNLPEIEIVRIGCHVQILKTPGVPEDAISTIKREYEK